MDSAPSNEQDSSAALAKRVQELEAERDALRQELSAAHAKQKAGDDVFRRFSDSGMIGIAVFDPAGKIVFANPALVRMIGCTAEDVEAGNVRWDLLKPAEGARQAREVFDELHSQGSCAPYEAEYLRADGARFWALFTGIMMDAQNAVAFLLDVTERKQAEEKLRLQAHRLAELYDAASLRAAQLVEADRLKDQFLAMLAHELRNPLGAMRNAIQVAQRTQPDSSAFQRSQAVLDRQSQHMSRLVDELLDVSRISRGKIELQRTRLDLVALAQEACEDNRRMLEAAGLLLTIELPKGPLWIRGDATRLGQALGNLLQNAAKFTDPGGSVRVRMVVPSRQGKHGDLPEVEVTVSDTGIGIADELLPRLFEPFVQADRSLARTQGGLGLGLALVKGIVELHGGHVRAQSDGVGRGATFRFNLPLPPDVAEETQDPPHLADTPARRVLVIEDNVDAAEALRDMLELAGHQVELAYSGPSGVEMARRTCPEIVLCDLGLPGMDGYEVAAALRQDPATAHTRLIAVSGYAQAEDRRRSARAGFELHLMKPVDPALLHEIMFARSTG